MDKQKADGSFDRIKARIVAYRKKIKKIPKEETFSPTANSMAIMTLLNIAAAKPEYELSAHDIKSAFLHTKTRKLLYIILKNDIVKYLVETYPRYKKFVNCDGSMYCRLGSYLYGLEEAPKEFNKLLTSTFTSIGFKQTRADPCIFIRKEKSQGATYVGDHIDDFMVVAPNKDIRIKIIEDLKKTFKDITSAFENFSYLGLLIERNKSKIKISQPGLLEEILEKNKKVIKTKKTKLPALSNLMKETEEDSPLVDSGKFQSSVMTLLYLARFTRLDILMPVAYLASRCANPKEEDEKKLNQIINYLYYNRDIGLTIVKKLTCRIRISPRIFNNYLAR